MRLAVAFVLLLSACHSDGLPNGESDAGMLPANNDGSEPIDAAGLSCAQIEASVQSWLAAHRSCTIDSDCAEVMGLCNAPDACNSFYEASSAGPYLTSLVNAWLQRHCAAACPACPKHDPPLQAFCNAGVCSYRQ
jgi:hypothetical protein